MSAAKVTMKKIPENRFRVKVNKWPHKKAAQMPYIGNNAWSCEGIRTERRVVHHPAYIRNEWKIRVRVLSA